jgi:hypothetical protein
MSSAFVDGHVYLDSRATMFAVLDELVGEDATQFRGTLASWPEQNPPGPAKWSIELYDWKGNKTRAEMGDHLIHTFGFLLSIPDSDFQEHQGS